MLDIAIQAKKYKDCLEFTNECLSFYYHTSIPIEDYDMFSQNNYETLKEWEEHKSIFENSNVIVCVKNKKLNIGFIYKNQAYLMLNQKSIVSTSYETLIRTFDEVFTYEIKG